MLLARYEHNTRSYPERFQFLEQNAAPTWSVKLEGVGDLNAAFRISGAVKLHAFSQAAGG
jgi:hypothetical protein